MCLHYLPKSEGASLLIQTFIFHSENFYTETNQQTSQYVFCLITFETESKFIAYKNLALICHCRSDACLQMMETWDNIQLLCWTSTQWGRDAAALLLYDRKTWKPVHTAKHTSMSLINWPHVSQTHLKHEQEVVLIRQQPETTHRQFSPAIISKE